MSVETASGDPRRLGANLFAAVIGQFVGDKSSTIAKIAMTCWGTKYSEEDVAGGSLYVILIFACVGALYAGWAARGTRERTEQVVTSTLVAVLVALLAIADYSLPVGAGKISIDGREAVYYVVWIVGLWHATLFFLPNTGGTGVRRGWEMLTVAATMTLIGLVVGFLLEQALMCMGRLGWLGGVDWKNTREFWVARPHAINAIFGGIFVVAFVKLWWRDLWPASTRTYGWTLSVVVLAAGYSGLYGVLFYGLGGTCWEQFAAFSMLPVAGVGAVLVAYAIDRQSCVVEGFGWPVGKTFWWAVSVGLAVSLVLCVLFGLAELADAKDGRLLVLMAQHGVNGLCLGGALRLMPVVSAAVCKR